MIEIFQKWYREHEEEILKDFTTFLSFPSVSTDPARKDKVRACAVWLIEYLEDRGLKADLWETTGHPTVFATHSKADPSRPTLLIYLHYDVQPEDPLDQWRSDPFAPEIRDGKIYARGAVDNKGQCFYTLTAIHAFLTIVGELGFNLKLCIEGEEETGSEGLEGILDEKREELAADHVLIIDIGMLSKNEPAITVGLRGIATLNLKCKAALQDLHSGAYGGFVMNPARALAQALSRCWDEKGRVAIPHFYDGIVPLSEEEKGEIYWEWDVEEAMELFSIKASAKEEGYTAVESNWIRPTLEINGMESGYTGEGGKTIIPAESMVKLSCRLVPGQDPEKVVEELIAFLKKNLGEGIEVEVEKGHGCRGFITSPQSPIAKIAKRAYEDVFHVPCKAILCGGTLPIAPKLMEASGGDLVAIGVALLEDGVHAPNESFGLDRFLQGFLSVVRIFEILGKGEEA